MQNDEDKELQDELRTLVEKIVVSTPPVTFCSVNCFLLKGQEKKLIPPALDMLKFLIRTSTTSMTSVPKPLKYLACYYDAIKKAYTRIDEEPIKRKCADIISVLAMGPTGGDSAKVQRECLKYCLLGNNNNNKIQVSNSSRIRNSKKHIRLGPRIHPPTRIGNNRGMDTLSENVLEPAPVGQRHRQIRLQTTR